MPHCEDGTVCAVHGLTIKVMRLVYVEITSRAFTRSEQYELSNLVRSSMLPASGETKLDDEGERTLARVALIAPYFAPQAEALLATLEDQWRSTHPE